MSVVLKPGVLPIFAGDDIPPIPDSLRNLRGQDGALRWKANQIAEAIEGHAEDPPARYHLWLALGEAWASACKPKAKFRTPEVMSAVVGDIDVDVTTAEEYRYSQYKVSEELDLDHLSSPKPE
ncbi:hypothetical protein ACFPZO_37045 [Microbispora camponoti]|uniref:hypothetical protein n=1 Tax=Microbispora bryophytorum TaxID=1460882 RepID=UPI00168A8454|nr:hypothetical protein [Microbispora camponoti]